MILSAALLAAALLAQPAPLERDYTFEKVASGFRFTEGPVWLPEGALLFSDIPSNRLLKWKPGSGVSTVRESSGGANGNAVDDRGRFYTCEGAARRVTRTTASGKVEVLAERFEGKRFNAPNDIVVRSDGHVWFTDPAFGSQDDAKELPFYGVFHISPRGELSVAARMDKRPNGIALSPNGRILYVAVSDERSVRAFDVDRSGAASNPRLFISGIDGPPDGIKTSRNGNLYIAGNAIQIYSPAGQLIRSLDVPEKPSNLAFGPDAKSFFVTTRATVYQVHFDGASPEDRP